MYRCTIVLSSFGQATRDLQAVYKDPSIISALCDLLLGSGNPQVISVIFMQGTDDVASFPGSLLKNRGKERAWEWDYRWSTVIRTRIEIPKNVLIEHGRCGLTTLVVRVHFLLWAAWLVLHSHALRQFQESWGKPPGSLSLAVNVAFSNTSCGMHKVLSTIDPAQSNGNSIGIELQTDDGVHMGT